MKYGLLVIFCALSAFLSAQVQTHLVTLSGDSILYANSKFKFVEFIDARKDTTKLGLLKENYNSAQHQLINFPTEIEKYLPSFINTVINYSGNAEEVCVVVKTLQIGEEPLGAIEIAKSKAVFHFYLKKDEQYKLIKTVEQNREQPSADVTKSLSAEMESLVRLAFQEFLTQPGSEGENNEWLTRRQLIEQEVPEKRIEVLPIGELDYSGLRFSLNEEVIKRKEALAILQNVEDEDINQLLDKNRKNFYSSIGFSIIATGLTAYPIYEYAKEQNEFKGNYVMFGTAAAILSLFSAKAYRDNMREAVDMYNERYNE